MFKLKSVLSSGVFYNMGSNNITSLKAIRKKNLPYIAIWVIYYAWVIVFTTWWTASPITDKVFGEGLRSMLHSVNLLSSAVFILVFQKKWFVNTARVGALLLITGIIIFLTIPNSSIQLLSAITIGITLGMVNISILMPFVFALNNTEQLYSVIGSNVLINLILVYQQEYFKNNRQLGNNDRIYSFIILIIALSAILFFKKEAITAEQHDTNLDNPIVKPRIYLTLVLNCVVAILCKGASKGIFNITAENYGVTLNTWYYIGGLGGCTIYLCIYAVAKKALHWLINITFSSIAMGLLCNAFMTEYKGMAVAFAVLLGIGSTIGMINMYFILAVVGKKYNSMRYLRLSIIFIGICGGVSGVAVGNLIDRINTFEISIIASIISVAFLLLFLMLSPTIAQAQYVYEDTAVSVIEETNKELPDLFKQYQLSRRETEVCKLLLEGYTLRQISAMLSIAYSTVNTYCTSAYRKLNINSRAELIILFKDYIKK